MRWRKSSLKEILIVLLVLETMQARLWISVGIGIPFKKEKNDIAKASWSSETLDTKQTIQHYFSINHHSISNGHNLLCQSILFLKFRMHLGLYFLQCYTLLVVHTVILSMCSFTILLTLVVIRTWLLIR